MKHEHKSRENENSENRGSTQNANADQQQTNEREQNPQDGREWENYRTREMDSREEKTTGYKAKGRARKGFIDPL
jgi:hypothetical protein